MEVINDSGTMHSNTNRLSKRVLLHLLSVHPSMYKAKMPSAYSLLDAQGEQKVGWLIGGWLSVVFGWSDFVLLRSIMGRF